MGMSNAQMRAFNNPVLVGLLLGASNASASFVGTGLFPQLPQGLSDMAIMKMGSAHLRKYGLRRAPGAPTKRIELQWGSQTVTLDQDAVEVLIPREVIRELDTAKRLNVGLWMEASQVAMATCRAVIDLSYELDCAERAADPATYADAAKFRDSSAELEAVEARIAKLTSDWEAAATTLENLGEPA